MKEKKKLTKEERNLRISKALSELEENEEAITRSFFERERQRKDLTEAEKKALDKVYSNEKERSSKELFAEAEETRKKWREILKEAKDRQRFEERDFREKRYFKCKLTDRTIDAFEEIRSYFYGRWQQKHSFRYPKSYDELLWYLITTHTRVGKIYSRICESYED